MTTPKHGIDFDDVLGKPRELTSSQVTDAVGIPTYKARRY